MESLAFIPVRSHDADFTLAVPLKAIVHFDSVI